MICTTFPETTVNSKNLFNPDQLKLHLARKQRLALSLYIENSTGIAASFTLQ